MSNTFPSSLDLPNQDSAVTGGQIFETDIKKLVESLNWAHANTGTGSLYCGTFRLETFQTIKTTPSGDTLRIRIPTISSHHVSLKVLVAYAGKGTLDVDIDNGGSTVTHNITLATSGSATNVIFREFNINSVSLGTNGYLTLNVGLTAVTSVSPAFTSLRVNSLLFYWAPLTSPLPTTQAQLGSDYFTPLAPARYDADMALPSFLGHTIIDNINTLRKRPRVYYNFCGLGEIFNDFDPSTAQYLRSYSFAGLSVNSPNSTKSHDYIFQGAQDFDDKLQVHLYVENYTSNFDIKICGHTLTITQNGWSNFEIDLPLSPDDYSDSLGLPSYVFGPSSSLGLNRDTNISSVIITSLAIWGP